MSAGSGKNLQLLGQEAPPWQQPTLQETITALQIELAKGVAVYTVDELRLLARKLAEEEERFRVITTGG
jgi:hypothetical protein